MTKHECAVIMAFTGVAMLKGNDLDIFYEYVAKILGRPVYTHEMAMLSEEIKEAARNDFVQLCRNSSAKPKTNADRIRQMTDEELAHFMVIQAIMGAISVNGIQDKAAANKIVKEIIMDHKADEDISDALRWLKQEVSEDAAD